MGVSNKISKLWSIPLITVYLYTATVLSQYGYNSYFNLPANFVEASIQKNITHFFDLLGFAQSVAGSMRWWAWIVAIVTTVVIVLAYFSSYTYKVLVQIAATIFLLFVLSGTYGYGWRTAMETTQFFVPSSNCQSIGPDEKYVVPSFFEGKAIFVPYDKDTHKMYGNFIVKDVAELGCALEKSDAGEILR